MGTNCVEMKILLTAQKSRSICLLRISLLSYPKIAPFLSLSSAKISSLAHIMTMGRKTDHTHFCTYVLLYLYPKSLHLASDAKTEQTQYKTQNIVEPSLYVQTVEYISSFSLIGGERGRCENSHLTSSLYSSSSFFFWVPSHWLAVVEYIVRVCQNEVVMTIYITFQLITDNGFLLLGITIPDR